MILFKWRRGGLTPPNRRLLSLAPAYDSALPSITDAIGWPRSFGIFESATAESPNRGHVLQFLKMIFAARLRS